MGMLRVRRKDKREIPITQIDEVESIQIFSTLTREGDREHGMGDSHGDCAEIGTMKLFGGGDNDRVT